MKHRLRIVGAVAVALPLIGLLIVGAVHSASAAEFRRGGADQRLPGLASPEASGVRGSLALRKARSLLLWVNSGTGGHL
jgi:hypothetical protein